MSTAAAILKGLLKIVSAIIFIVLGLAIVAVGTTGAAAFLGGIALLGGVIVAGFAFIIGAFAALFVLLFGCAALAGAVDINKIARDAIDGVKSETPAAEAKI